VLVAGGQPCANGYCSTLTTAEIYDPATGVFTPTGSMYDSRLQFSMTALTNGLVLVAGPHNRFAAPIVRLLYVFDFVLANY
jgi:hypothetical protein